MPNTSTVDSIFNGKDKDGIISFVVTVLHRSQIDHRKTRKRREERERIEGSDDCMYIQRMCTVYMTHTHVECKWKKYGIYCTVHRDWRCIKGSYSYWKNFYRVRVSE